MQSRRELFDCIDVTGDDITSDAFFPSIFMCDRSASEMAFIVLNEGSTSPDSSFAMSDWLTPATLASSDCVIPNCTLIFLSCLGSIVETDISSHSRQIVYNIFA